MLKKVEGKRTASSKVDKLSYSNNGYDLEEPLWRKSMWLLGVNNDLMVSNHHNQFLKVT